jgi:hypothetical protein
MQLALSPFQRRFLVWSLVLFLLAWTVCLVFIWHVMHQPPAVFGRVMSRMPGPVVFLLFPFETMWTHARAGHLRIGDPAPDFSLMKQDKSVAVDLASLTGHQPVVLVFGSYT